MRLFILTAAYASGWPGFIRMSQARARRPTQPAEAATPQIIFCAATPAPGLSPLVWVECAKAARHEPEHTLRQDGEEPPCGKRSRHWALPSTLRLRSVRWRARSLYTLGVSAVGRG